MSEETKSKRTKKIVVGCILFVFIFLAVAACFYFQKPKKVSNPPYESQYTPEEHVRSLTKITEDKFSYLIETEQLADIRVEILYAIDDDPEYFLITLEFAEEFEGGNEIEGLYMTKYMHTIGVIQDDEYIMGLERYKGSRYKFGNSGKLYEIETWWREGRSLYDLCTLNYSKKYYGDNTAIVQTYDGLVALFKSSGVYDRMTIEHNRADFEQFLISPYKYESCNVYSILKDYKQSYIHKPLGYIVFPNHNSRYNAGANLRFLKD